MPQRSAQQPKYSPKLVAQCDVVRCTGLARSTISEACAGPLALAYTGSRLDLAHPVAREWFRARGFDADRFFSGVRQPRRTDGERLRHPARTATTRQIARRTRSTVAEVREALAEHVLPAHHVDANTLAALADCTADDVFDAVQELAGAVQANGYVDLRHASVLAFMARRPFKRSPDGELLDAPEGFLAPAMVGDEVDADHPVTQIFLARCLARVPTESDIGAAT